MISLMIKSLSPGDPSSLPLILCPTTHPTPSAPLGRVAATASLATRLPLRTYNLSGVLARNDGEESRCPSVDGMTLPRKIW